MSRRALLTPAATTRQSRQSSRAILSGEAHWRRISESQRIFEAVHQACPGLRGGYWTRAGLYQRCGFCDFQQGSGGSSQKPTCAGAAARCLIPARGVERLALEFLHTGDAGQLRHRQDAVSQDHEARTRERSRALSADCDALPKLLTSKLHEGNAILRLRREICILRRSHPSSCVKRSKALNQNA
jgi:hypothetical protein